MESLGTAVLELVADTKPLVAGLEKGKAASEEMAATTAQGFKGGITKAAIPAAAAVGALVIGLHKSVDAAEADQKAQVRLDAAYKTAGLNADDYKGSIDKTIQSSADLGFQSGEVKQALGSLIVATQDHKKSLELLGIAQDIARFKGTSLEASTKTMTMAMSGSQRAIKQLGLSISPVTTEEDKLKLAVKDHTTASYAYQLAQAKQIDHNKTEAAVIQLVQQKLKGQAQAYAETGQGMKEKMGAEMNLLEINIGKMLLPALEMVIGALSSVTEWMTKHAAVAKILIIVVGTLGTAILLVAGYLKIAAAMQALWNGAMDANPIGLIILAIAALVIGFVELWKHSQTFRDIVLGVWKDITDATTTFVDFFTKTVPGAFQAVKDWVAQHWPEIAVLLSGPFAPIVALATNGFGVRDKLIGAFKDVVDWMRDKFKAVKGWVTAPFNDAWTVISDIPGKVKTAFGKIGGWFNTAKDWAIKKFITQPFSDAWDFISNIPGKISGAFSDLGKKGSKLMGAFSAIGSGIVAVLKAPINAVIKIIDAIKLPSGIHIKTWHGIPDGFSIDWSTPFHIPMLAAGGIVTSPTLAMIGERGAEAVIPLDGKHGVGGGPTINVYGVVGNERDVALKIGRELQKLNDRGVHFGVT